MLLHSGWPGGASQAETETVHIPFVFLALKLNSKEQRRVLCTSLFDDVAEIVCTSSQAVETYIWSEGVRISAPPLGHMGKTWSQNVNG